MIVKGGKQVYGAPVGILCLDTRFPRIPGDLANAETWPFPVLFRNIEGAEPDRIVRQRAAGMLDPFIDGGRELIRQGAEVITTSCGFLSLFQDEMKAALGVPVATSSLMQVPMVQALLPPGRRVGVLTISAPSLTPEHLACAGCPADTPVIGTEGGTEFTRAIIGDELFLDIGKCEADLIAAARALVEAHPDLGAIVMECTNMPPFQAAVRAAVDLPVFSIIDYVCWMQGSVRPRRWG